MSKVDALDYLLVLTEEIAVLKSRLQPTDTGHIHTTINVLQERVEELKEKVRGNL